MHFIETKPFKKRSNQQRNEIELTVILPLLLSSSSTSNNNTPGVN